MKKLHFPTLFILFLCLQAGAQSCPPSGISFTTQSEIDNFTINYPGCTVIDGNVSLYGSDIVNLNGLSGITAINYDLQLGLVPNLTSLNGLQNVTSIGRLQIYNSGLTDLSGLQNLSSLQGLEIGFVGSNSPSLTSLNGMPNVTTLQSLQLYEPVLTNLHGLENITTVGYLDIFGCPNLVSLDGLDNLVSAGNTLLIRFNFQLTSLHGLHNLSTIGGDLGIWANPLLTNLDGFEHLTSVGAVNEAEGLNIFNNGMLSDCSIAAICDHLVQRPATSHITSNAPGCNSNTEVGDQCLMGTSETLGQSLVSILPNPNAGSFSIELPRAADNDMSFQILSHTGQVLRVQILQPGLSIQPVQAADLPAGLYFLQVVSNGRLMAVEKFAKQ